MPTWLTSIWLKLAAFGSFIVFILLAIASIFRKGEQAGQAKIEQANTKAVQKAQEQANDASNQVSQAPDGAAASALEKDWTK